MVPTYEYFVDGFVYIKEKVGLCFMDGSGPVVSVKKKVVFFGGKELIKIFIYLFLEKEKIIFK